jgi:dolichol-phosphate mannosyltransferase
VTSRSKFYKIRIVIVIPTYNETKSIETLLNNLLPKSSSDTAVIICDDSGANLRGFYRDLCSRLEKKENRIIDLSFSEIKSGRGSAVIRGFAAGREKYPMAQFYIECDADGSHQVTDILKVIDQDYALDFVIGSRYLPTSKIVGWPISRRVFSKVLNIIIPKVLKLNTSDATNGLRRYSRAAVDQILKAKMKTSGFIALSEVAMILNSYSINPLDVPIKFVNRQLGKSTVTGKEIWHSIAGLVTLLRHKYVRK